MNQAAFSKALDVDVSRETYDRLCIYHDELVRWSRTHNLIGPKEHSHIWQRHFVDCYQLVPLMMGIRSLVDIGSGAGFPGLVIACARSMEFNPDITLVEPNHKRVAFLKHVSRQLDLNVRVLPSRIEDVSRETFDMVTSRAVTDLSGLFEMSEPLLKNGAKALFLKGQTAEEELTKARRYWNFKVQLSPSRSDSHGVVLSLSEVRSQNG